MTDTGAIPSAARRREIDSEIERLVAPGLAANAWRPDFDTLRQRRLHDEQFQKRHLRQLRRHVRGLRRAPILDLGTGRGGLAVALRQRGYDVTALDLRHRNCRIARLRAERHGLRVPAVCAKGERLPFAGRTFGLVICRDVLEHCRDPERLLREIRRVLRPGGTCYLTVINRFCWIDPHYRLAGISFLPRPLAERYIAWRRRAKESGADRQRLSDMNYYRYADFVRRAEHLGFVVFDLQEAELRGAARSLSARIAWLRHRALRPLSLQAPHFEFLLRKVRRGGTA